MFVQKAFAASTTNTTSEPGQVQVKSQDDVLYLDTKTNGTNLGTINSSPLAITQPAFSFSTASNIFNGPSQIIKPIGFVDDLGTYLGSILSLVMVVCVLLVFYHFIHAGLQWITSGGDKSRIEEARLRITHAFIGIIIVSASFATVGFIAYLLGFQSYQDILSAVPRLNTI